VLDRQGLTSLRNSVEVGDHRIEEAEEQLTGVLKAEECALHALICVNLS